MAILNMPASEYNADQIQKGALTPDHITTMVRNWQDTNGLAPDGYAGPLTVQSLTPVEEGADPRSSVLGLAALKVAIEELGNGEEGGNNSGPHVARYKRIVDDGDLDDDGAWCAALISFCFETACERLGLEMPFKRSQGAKRLWKNIGRAGSFPDTPAPGDVVCWDRGKKGSWQGHIGFIESYDAQAGMIKTVEGNTGRYPSRTRRLVHDLTRQDRLEGYGRCT